ncbi:MAG TPA: hypothetical protein VF228_01105 [Iamia sp.]
MPVTEESRHRLHRKLDQTIGEEDATTLMEHLPPTGWIDIATKQDIQALDVRFEMIDQRFDLVDEHFEALTGRSDARFTDHDHRFDALDRTFASIEKTFDSINRRLDRIEDTMRSQLRWLLMFLVAYSSLLVAAVRL